MNINDNLMINLKNNLFNENSIKKYSNNFILTPQKRVKLERYIERVQNNEFKGETKGYPAFLKFLEDILDYEEGKHIRFDDLDDIGSGRVEFALRDNDGKFMVIELKGQNADLDKPQNRANDKHSPVEQAFGYAYHSSKKSGLVQWILVSNYKEFRLYNYEKRLGEYISFNVEDLLNDDIFKFFMFAFSKESHVDLKAINDVVNENYIEKTQLANNFYKLFNETRLMIYKELNELHGMDKNDAISNAQTILDRFIFICFASSRELLPENIVRNTLLKRIKNEDIRDHEIWRDLNYLFLDVDIGNDDRNISKYNGGLFKEDLNGIKLKDIIKDTNFFKDVYQKWNFKEFEERLKKEIKPSILKRINPIYINLLIISYFDFSEENKEDTKHKLDIEILGHIFENSIGDLEELKEDSKGRRKKDGIFYTPDYITDYICKNTIIPYLSISGNVNTVEGLLKEYSTGREIEKLDQNLKNIKIVDPACGSGAFLNKATDILLEIHKGIFEIKKSFTTSESIKTGKGKRRKTENVKFADIGVYVFDDLSKRREILLDNIYGVDLNSESVEITKLSLFLKVCEKGKILPAIDKNIRCGNSIIDNPKYTDKPFNWNDEFKEIFKEGGFDIVIGNPPYGAKLSNIEIKFVKENYSVKNSETAQIMMEKAYSLLKNGGYHSFIIPKAFIFVSTWDKIRTKFLDELNLLVDCKKVWNEVKLEQIIYTIQKGNKFDKYNSGIIENQSIKIIANIDKSLIQDFGGILLNSLSNQEIKIGSKVKEINNYLTDFGNDGRGDLFYQQMNNDKKGFKVLGGKGIQRYYTRGIKGYIEGKFIKQEQSLIKENSILLQRIIAHIENPIDHIKIAGTIFDDFHYRIVDTVYQITLDNGISNRYVLAVINSNFMNWFVYRFIFAKAIRSFQFSRVVAKKIPIPNITLEKQKPFIEKVNLILQLNKVLMNEINGFKDWLERTYKIEKFSQKLGKYYKLSFDDFLNELKKIKVNTNQRKTQELLKETFEESINVINPLLQQIKETDNEIDKMVYDLYGLTNEEIKIIEDNI